MTRKTLYFGVCTAMMASIRSALADQNCASLNGDSTLSSTASQLLLVNGQENSSKAYVSACERVNSEWISASIDVPAVVGTNGVAASGTKVEGDNKTPSGTFGIGEFFGWTTFSDSVVQSFKSDYRYIVDVKDANGAYLDKFIDDAKHPFYNMWVSGTTDATSFEQMRISAYKYGFVISYNTYPSVVAGKGSAVFFHIWSGPNGSTAGCVAVEEANLVTIMQWLDKAKQPLIRIVGSAAK